jgi:hypothetical protein
MFLCHLSKDPIVIEEMLKVANSIFSSYHECDLDLDVMFLNKMEVIKRFDLVEDSRKKLLEDKDQTALEGGIAPKDMGKIQDTEEYRSLSSALRTIQIIGQILRNFAGSLRGELKVQLADWCIKVALRTMAFVFKRGEANFENIAPTLKALLLHELISFNDSDYMLTRDQEEEADAFVRKLVFNLFEELAFYLIDEASFAVGAKKLTIVLREVTYLDPSVSRRLISVAAKLSRAGEFPEQEVLGLAKELHKNPFAETLLRRLVWQRFYIFPDSFRIRQRVCRQLRISFSDPRLRDTRNKLS